MDRRKFLHGAVAAPLVSALAAPACAGASLAHAQHHHDRAVPARRAGRSRGAAGRGGARENPRPLGDRRQPHRRRRHDRQCGGGAGRARRPHAADGALLDDVPAGSRAAVRPQAVLRIRPARADRARAGRPGRARGAQGLALQVRSPISSPTPRSGRARSRSARPATTAPRTCRSRCSSRPPASSSCTCPIAAAGRRSRHSSASRSTSPRRRPARSIPHVQSGAARLLANWGGKRTAELADIPTMIELGYHDVEYYIWAGAVRAQGHARAGHHAPARRHARGHEQPAGDLGVREGRTARRPIWTSRTSRRSSRPTPSGSFR